MITYDFYITEYKGNIIPSDTSFDNLAIRAKAYVDTLVTDRTNIDISAVMQKYNFAICSVADVMSQTQTAIKSESVGNHNITFASETETNKTMYKNAMLFLAGTGLTYRGLQ